MHGIGDRIMHGIGDRIMHGIVCRGEIRHLVCNMREMR
jgi:hypothetical protein